MKFKKMIEDGLGCRIRTTEVVAKFGLVYVRIHCVHGAFTGVAPHPDYVQPGTPAGVDAATKDALKGFRQHAHPHRCHKPLPPVPSLIVPNGNWYLEERPGCAKWPEHDGDCDHFLTDADGLKRYQYDSAVHYAKGEVVDGPCPRPGDL